ncbi:PAS domain S-box protein [Sphingobacterium anhuiense]|uniref:histidine kinase n=1 Tax=Sphingobacterium anhuiense TaxID=493780 RepID=A0ABW5YS42_9SPHI
MEFHNQALDKQNILLETLGFEGLVALDYEGHILALNNQAKSLLPFDKIAHKKLHEALIFYSKEGQHPIHPNELSFNKTLETGAVKRDIIYGITTEDNTLIWLSFSSKLIADRPDIHMLISIQDVSPLVNENKKLLDSKQELQLLITSLDDIVFEVTKEGVFKNYWTSEPDLLFYEPEEFLNKNIVDLFPSEMTEKTLPLINKALTYNKVYHMEFPSPFDTHKGRWFKLKIKPIHSTKDRVAVVVSDISQKIKSLEKIRYNQHKFNQAFHFSGLGISLTDTQGYCLDANNMLSKILGFSQEELSCTNFFDYIHPDDINNDYQQRQRLLKGEMDSFTLEKRYRHQLGHYVWCSVTTSVVHNQSNEVSFFIVQLQDISECKKNLEILERQKKEIEIVKIDLETKVRQLEEFNHIVAHNLREPVSNIHMLIDELKDENRKEVNKEYFRLLKSSNNSLTDTLQELSEILEISQNRNIEKVNCHFPTIFKKVYDQFLAEIYSKKVILTTDFEIEYLQYPRIYLESIIYNLLSNALKYTVPRVQPKIHIRTFQQNNSTLLSIQDNGIGIDLPKFKSQIFMFRKVFHRGFDSKGLGLFITRYQIESLGGKIDVISKPNNGTTFLVNFLENN